jgi:hypothetical protein
MAMSSYCLFIEFLVAFLECLKESSKEEEAFAAYILIKAYINLHSSAILLVRVPSKGK